MQEVAQGRVWSGRDALAVGLVDALGGVSRAVAVAKQAAGLSAWHFWLHALQSPVRMLRHCRACAAPGHTPPHLLMTVVRCWPLTLLGSIHTCTL